MRIKIVNQRDAMDCGPSCLAMIVELYGRKADKEYLRNACSLSKDGVFFIILGIYREAEIIGLKEIG